MNQIEPGYDPRPPKRPLSEGVEVIRQALRTIGQLPGCYQMFDSSDKPLYVGKARFLQRRVQSYTQISRLQGRIQRMVSETVRVETILTRNEAEALLLEASLIKKLKPRYNILLRDDKMLPSIRISTGHEFPRIMKHRGAHDSNHLCFGPFASGGAVNTAVATLQKVFRLRECSDHVLKSARRPCMLYELKRCSAPCVNRISPENYAKQVALARSFFDGRKSRIQRDLSSSMKEAADEQKYELAAEYRDRLTAFGMLRADQGIYDARLLEADVLYLHMAGSGAAIAHLIWRSGSFCGLRTLFPRIVEGHSRAEIMAAVIGQLYSGHMPPRRIVVSDLPDDYERLEELLHVRTGLRIRIIEARGKRLVDLLQQAKRNAEEALAQRVVDLDSWKADWQRLESFMEIDDVECVEIYDSSHIQGRFAVSAKVVATREGWKTELYRMYQPPPKIAQSGDDLAMLRSALSRRLQRLKNEVAKEGTTDLFPSLMIIDGGRTHLQVAAEELKQAGLNKVALMAVAKGEGRKSGLERVYRLNNPPIDLSRDNEALFFFILRLRDEAHRFAIGRHRARRAKAVRESPLEGIAGVGLKRRAALLRQFGSLKVIKNSSAVEIGRVEGISQTLARRIHEQLQNV